MGRAHKRKAAGGYRAGRGLGLKTSNQIQAILVHRNLSCQTI
jgi:hypothetical protein